MVLFELRSKGASPGVSGEKYSGGREQLVPRAHDLSTSEGNKESRCGWNLMEARRLISSLMYFCW